MTRVSLDDVTGKNPADIARKARVMAAPYFGVPANSQHLIVLIGTARPAEMIRSSDGDDPAVTLWKADVEVVRKK